MVKFLPVDKLSTDDLRQMVAHARKNRNTLYWTPREKDAWRELKRREQDA